MTVAAARPAFYEVPAPMQAVFLGTKGYKVDGQVLGEHIGREHAGKLQEHRRPGGVVVAARTFLTES